MLRSILALAHASATLIAAAACSAAPSPPAGDSVTPSAPATAPAGGTPTPIPAASPSRPDSANAAPAPVQSSFTRILTQHTSGFDEPVELVIRDQAKLESAWKTLFNGIPGNAPPAVDLAKEMVILVALGGRSSGGYSAQVDAVTRGADGAVVRYTVTSPGAGCMTTQSLTSPVDVVRAPRIDGKVRFERREIVQAC
jgi:hypothetical protein